MIAKYQASTCLSSPIWLARRMSVLFIGMVLATNAGATDVALPKPITLKDRSLEEYVQLSKPATFDSRPQTDYIDRYTDDPGDGLFFAPGVWVNALDVYEPRIVLRGFGIGNRQERSTVIVLRNGNSLTDVHGSTNAQEIDLLAVDRIDIYRGSGDFQFTGGNLGGVLNYISPTGLSMPSGLSGRVDAGSSIDGTPGGRAHLDIAGTSKSGLLDYYSSVTGKHETGFRDQNSFSAANFNSNIGYQFSPGLKTRFFLDVTYSGMELSGGLLPAEALADATQAASAITLGPLFPGGPIIEFVDGAQDDYFSRNLFAGRVSNQTEFRLFGHDFESRLHFAHREVDGGQIDFVGVLEEVGNEWGAQLAAKRDLSFLRMDAHYRIGGAYSTGSKSSDRFENIDGIAGDQLVDTEHQSTNITAFIEAGLRPLKRLVLDLGAKFIIADRELTVDDSDNPDEVRYTGVAAKLGLLYHLFDNVQLFISGSRSYEPPSFSEAISDNPENFNNLIEQDAFTYEAGLRGKVNDWLAWDLTYFNVAVENEIINVGEPETNGIADSLDNADNTTHKGFELGLDLRAFQSSNGSGVSLRNAYSYNDFRFVDAGSVGPFDGNRLGGIPQHVYRGELRYDNADHWYAALNVQVAGGEFFADHENIISVPTYTTLGFSAGMQLNDRIVIFASGENITNQNFVGGITPVASQGVENGRIFTPAAGATIYGGLRYRF